MPGPLSPPVLYLIDDDDDNDEIESEDNINGLLNRSSASSYESSAGNKRKYSDGNLSTISNHFKRSRMETHSSAFRVVATQNEPEPIVLDSDDYHSNSFESHRFHAFDWTNDAPRGMRSYSESIPRMPIVPIPTYPSHPFDLTETISPMDLNRSQMRKTISIPNNRSPPSLLPLPIPKPTSSINRSGISARSQPVKSVPNLHTTTTSPPLDSFGEIRRQALNGTENLSAFYDSKCYRCNTCKFQTTTSSLLLQHLFSHMFFCPHCSFYSSSHHQFYQHLYDKHRSLLDTDGRDPQTFDLLYMTRCSDGTFALCMDSSSKGGFGGGETILSHASANPPHILPKKSRVKRQESLASTEKNPPSQSRSSTVKDKSALTYMFMKHRRTYTQCLHSLTLEYQICREHTIRHMSRTKNRLRRHKCKSNSDVLRLIDVVAQTLKTVVNAVACEEEKDLDHQSSLLFPLPSVVVDSIFPLIDLKTMFRYLKLTNKYDQSYEQSERNSAEHVARTSDQYVFVVSSPTIRHFEQTIFNSVTTSITNSDSGCLQTKFNELPLVVDNTHRFLKDIPNSSVRPAKSLSKSKGRPPLTPSSSKDRSSPIPPVIVLD